MRIVLVEDNLRLAQGIRNALVDQGHAVDCLHDGQAGDDFLRTSDFDIAIVDLNLPKLSGIELVRALRARGSTAPVLILSARDKVSDRVAGLNAGADDYLVKPFEMEELLARLRALSRRRPNMLPLSERLGDIVYDRSQRQVILGGEPVDLPRRELALFELLLDHKGRLLSKTQIADALYGTGAVVEPNAVELLVSRLRRKIEGHGVAIRTARGLGYLMHGSDG